MCPNSFLLEERENVSIILCGLTTNKLVVIFNRFHFPQVLIVINVGVITFLCKYLL